MKTPPGYKGRHLVFFEKLSTARTGHYDCARRLVGSPGHLSCVFVGNNGRVTVRIEKHE